MIFTYRWEAKEQSLRGAKEFTLWRRRIQTVGIGGGIDGWTEEEQKKDDKNKERETAKA